MQSQRNNPGTEAARPVYQLGTIQELIGSDAQGQRAEADLVQRLAATVKP